ncbi:hypothetical protein Tco_1074108 [Tanacetum coccineum]
MCDKNLVHDLKAMEKPDALCKGCLEVNHAVEPLVGSTSPASSTTGGGAPKRYRLLTDIYEECDELLFMQDADEPTSYLTAAKDREWVKAMKVELDAIEKSTKPELS